MSRKIAEADFLKRFYSRYPDARISIKEYSSLKTQCTVKCEICEKEYTKSRAEGFLTSWPCCRSGESKVDLVARLCEKDGNYQFIKQVGNTHVIIKHLICGNELKKTIQAAVGAPCSCPNCNTQRDKLRITIQDAQEQLDKTFDKNITLLFFDGVDSTKSQYRCNQCGLIFNQSHYNLLSKCRGCPKCDQRRSKGERAMRAYLEERNFNFKEQVSFKELGRLKFDFCIYDNNNNILALIEVQGDQHYQEVFRYPSRPNYFQTQINNDQNKRDWCQLHNIPLYEIYNNSGKLEGLDILSNLNSTTISVKESTP